MTEATSPPQTLTGGEETPGPAPTRRPRLWRRLVLTVLAAVTVVASLAGVGLTGLIPFGLLLAFSTGADDDATGRSVIGTRRNLGLAAAMVAAFVWFWWWHLDLPETVLVAIAAALIAAPLLLRESASETESRFVVTQRSLILSIWALVIFVALYYDYGQSFNVLTAVCVVLPVVLVVSRVWSARRGRVELGLLRHPLRRRLRPHLVQGLNIWVCCALLGGVIAAGATHYARIGFAFTAPQFQLMIIVFTFGLVLLSGLALVPVRRVHLATNVVVALLSGFLAVQLIQISTPAADPVVLDSPLAGEWFVLNGGHSLLLNGHSPNESHAVDFLQLGANGRTHTGGRGAPLSAYAGFGQPVLAPAGGRIVEVTDGTADTPPGTNGDQANTVVMDIGGGRYLVLGHLKQGSVTVQVGEIVRRGQPLAAVGNSGHTNEPHLHLQVQDSPTGRQDADRTYPMVFTNSQITRGGPWPWADPREPRTGDLVRAIRP